MYLKLDDENAGENAMLKDSYALKHQVKPVQIVEPNVKICKTSLQAFKETQFPLTFAWACTVHNFKVLH